MGCHELTHHVQFNCTLDIPRKYLQTGPKRGQRVDGVICYIPVMHIYCLILQRGISNQHHRNAKLNIYIPSNHLSLLRIALLWHRRHPRHLKIQFHLNRKSCNDGFAGGRRIFTTHNIPFQSIFIKGVTACPYPCSFRIYPCLLTGHLTVSENIEQN